VLISKGVFSDSPISMLKQAIQATLLRHKVISENISNVSTPGYKAKDVSFQKRLSTARRRLTLRPVVTNPAHLRPGGLVGLKIRTVQNPTIGSGPEGNNVDMEEQVAKMEENGIAYAAYTQSLASAYRRIQESMK